MRSKSQCEDSLRYTLNISRPATRSLYVEIRDMRLAHCETIELPGYERKFRSKVGTASGTYGGVAGEYSRVRRINKLSVADS